MHRYTLCLRRSFGGSEVYLSTVARDVRAAEKIARRSLHNAGHGVGFTLVSVQRIHAPVLC